jgi:putative sterol carrier protein
MARMFTRELIDESIEACNNDAAHLERAKLLTGKVILRALDAPGGTDVSVTYTFAAGKCSGYDFVEEPSPASFRDKPFKAMIDGLTRITAGYGTFVKLDKGEIEPAAALNSPDYKVEGNMVMLMPLMQAVTSWTEKVRAIPKEY